MKPLVSQTEVGLTLEQVDHRDRYTVSLLGSKSLGQNNRYILTGGLLASLQTEQVKQLSMDIAMTPQYTELQHLATQLSLELTTDKTKFSAKYGMNRNTGVLDTQSLQLGGKWQSKDWTLYGNMAMSGINGRPMNVQSAELGVSGNANIMKQTYTLSGLLKYDGALKQFIPAVSIKLKI